MPAPTPKLKSAAVVGEVNEILKAATHYLDKRDSRILRLMRDAEAMIKADPAEAYSAMGSINQLSGDYERAVYCIENAIKLAPSEPVYLMNKCSYLINLGFFSDAQSVFERVAKPEIGLFTRAWNQGYVCGAFESMARHLEQARAMQLDLSGLDVDTAERAARVLRDANISQAEAASVLDIAGSLLREHRLFYLDDVPGIRVHEELGAEGFIAVNYDVGVSPTEAHQLYTNLVDRLVERAPAAPRVLSVSFRSGGKQYERSAA